MLGITLFIINVVAAPVDVSRVSLLLLYLDALHASLILLVRRSVRRGHHPSHGTWRSNLTEQHSLGSHGPGHPGSHLLSSHAGTDLVDVLLPVGTGDPALAHPGLELLVGHPSPTNKVF